MRRFTPFHYYGGKMGIVQWILDLMPPHTTYVEPFGGAAAVLLAKQPAKIEIYNDLDHAVYGFFKLLKDPAKAKLLRHHLELTPYSREIYDDLVERFESITDEIDKAVAFVIIANQSRNGQFGAGWKVSALRDTAQLYFRGLDCIETAVRRFRGVHVENRDFENVIRRYDTASTLYYLDPPYVATTRVTPKAYRHEMTVADHERLLNTVKQVQGMVMLSGFSGPQYEEALQGWERHEKTVYCSSSAAKKGNNESRNKYRTEVIWLNPQAAEARRKANSIEATLGGGATSSGSESNEPRT